MTDTATGVLRREHQLIVRMLDVLEALIAQGAERMPLDDLDRTLAFFRLFADACHHGKEEGLLFETLAEQGFPREEGPIAVMLHEHRMGRALVRDMVQAGEELRSGDAHGWRDLERAARDYVALLRAHIQKEDGVLFDVADFAVTGPACRALCEAYHTACAGRFEGRSIEELETLAGDLIERYGNGRG